MDTRQELQELARDYGWTVTEDTDSYGTTLGTVERSADIFDNGTHKTKVIYGGAGRIIYIYSWEARSGGIWLMGPSTGKKQAVRDALATGTVDWDWLKQQEREKRRYGTAGVR